MRSTTSRRAPRWRASRLWPVDALLAFSACAALALFGGIAVQTGANAVTAKRSGLVINSVSANTLKPAACSAITLTAIVIGSGVVNGTAANELVIGSTGIDTITARGGNDCVLGGGGNDAITGNAGTDICIGGPGTDTFNTCETQVQ